MDNSLRKINRFTFRLSKINANLKILNGKKDMRKKLSPTRFPNTKRNRFYKKLEGGILDYITFDPLNINSINDHINSILTTNPDYNNAGLFDNSNLNYIEDILAETNAIDIDDYGTDDIDLLDYILGLENYEDTNFDTTKTLKLLFADNGIQIRIASDFRPNSKTKLGRISWHSQRRADGQPMAYDIVPLDGNYEKLKFQMLNSPEIRNYFKHYGYGVINETIPEIMQRTGATGKHFHIGPDRLARRTWQDWLNTSIFNRNMTSKSTNTKYYPGKLTFDKLFDEVAKEDILANQYRNVLTSLAAIESGFNPHIQNLKGKPAYGYFQFWEGPGAYNITLYANTSVNNFILNPKLLIKAAIKLMKANLNSLTNADYMKANRLGLNSQDMLAIMWFSGLGGLRKYLNGIELSDGTTTITQYIKRFRKNII